jgi:LDH2 family malate/lactate/ureidoglycolate dehydrogenase
VTDQNVVLLTRDEAMSLMTDVAVSLGESAEDAEVIARHLVDDELRGVVGMSRIFIAADDLTRDGMRRITPMKLTRDAPAFAMLDGGGHLGFVVAERATEIAIEKAASNGIAVVGANNHRYSGTLAYYAEMAARRDLVLLAVASGSFSSVAPYGGREGRLDTNPMAIGFPTNGDPIVWDIATSAISGSEVYRRMATREPLPDGVAIDVSGAPTHDPRAALDGALLSWGGHRGSGMAEAIRLLSMLCGLAPFPVRGDEFGFLAIAIDPSMLHPLQEFKDKAEEFARGIRATAPASGFDSVRMPYDRSLAEREKRRKEGIPLSAAVHARLEGLRGPTLG